MSIAIILWIAALVLFIIAAFGVPSRINPVAAGLACATAAFLVPMLH